MKDHSVGDIVGVLTEAEWQQYETAIPLQEQMTEMRESVQRLLDTYERNVDVLRAMKTLWWYAVRLRLGMRDSRIVLEVDETTKEVKIKDLSDLIEE